MLKIPRNCQKSILPKNWPVGGTAIALGGLPYGPERMLGNQMRFSASSVCLLACPNTLHHVQASPVRLATQMPKEVCLVLFVSPSRSSACLYASQPLLSQMLQSVLDFGKITSLTKIA